MKLYRFICAGHVAVSTNPTGALLPPSKKPWIPNGSINVKAHDRSRVGASPKEILTSIRKHGYFVWSARLKALTAAHCDHDSARTEA